MNAPARLVDVLVIIVILAFLFMMFLPSIGIEKPRPGRMGCVNNLKQIGQAEFGWATDHGDKFPFEVLQTNGGTMEFTTGLNAWRHFQILSNGFDTPHEWRNSEWIAKALDTPKVLICPADSDRLRKASTNFARLSNTNLSYFIGLDCDETNPQGVLCGDRNITNGTPIRNGILELTTNNPAGWTEEMHKKVGNVLLSDGSLQMVSGTGLRQAVENSGVFTNHFQMPTLGP